MRSKLKVVLVVGLLSGCVVPEGNEDAGFIDAGLRRDGGSDAGTPALDAGLEDAGTSDAGPEDAGSPDAGPEDGGSPDAGSPDAGAADSGISDGGSCVLPDEDGANIVLSIGHTDILDVGLECQGQRLHLALADGTDRLQATLETLRAPENVLLHGNSVLVTQVPSHMDLPEFAFLGPEGSNIYLFPEVQVDGALWPGFKSYRFPAGVALNDELSLDLESVVGPGPMYAFYGFSPGTPLPMVFDLDAGLDALRFPAGTHTHLNWAFPVEGLHRVQFKARAQFLDGGVVESASRSYRFFLGDLANLPVSEPTVITVEGAEPGGYGPGQMMTLTVAQYGAPSVLAVMWERQCYQLGDAGEPLEDGGFFLRDAWTVQPSSNGTFSTLPSRACQYRASLTDGLRRVAVSQTFAPVIN